jgi:hypothetical protein
MRAGKLARKAPEALRDAEHDGSAADPLVALVLRHFPGPKPGTMRPPSAKDPMSPA